MPVHNTRPPSKKEKRRAIAFFLFAPLSVFCVGAYTDIGMKSPVTSLSKQENLCVYFLAGRHLPPTIAGEAAALSFSAIDGKAALYVALPAEAADRLAPTLSALGARTCGAATLFTLHGIALRRCREVTACLRACLAEMEKKPPSVFASEEGLSFLLPPREADILFDRVQAAFFPDRQT